jgi:hypothetical protein
MTSPQFSDGTEPALGLTLVEDEGADGVDPDDDPAGGGAVPDYDVDAPFGRFANGKPRKSPKGSRAATSKPTAKRRGPAAPRKVSGATAARKRGPDYVGASVPVIHLAQAATGMLGAATKDPAWSADTATLVVFEPQLAQTSGDLADQHQVWARTLDKLSTGASWAPALGIAVAFGAQILVNHGLLPPGLMGTRAPEQLMADAATVVQMREAKAEADLQKRMAAAA